ncbi:MAG: hypothetical protein CMM07_22310 [Rhodopirellula sp.]|nr:hypothetical protein [Rhodopirellula sp.]
MGLRFCLQFQGRPSQWFAVRTHKRFYIFASSAGLDPRYMKVFRQIRICSDAVKTCRPFFVKVVACMQQLSKVFLRFGITGNVMQD